MYTFGDFVAKLSIVRNVRQTALFNIYGATYFSHLLFKIKGLKIPYEKKQCVYHLRQSVCNADKLF